MAKLAIPRTRSLLQKFEFGTLFIEVLGWSQPSVRKPTSLVYDGMKFESRQIAELAGVVVLEITTQDGGVPNAKIRTAFSKLISKQHHENLLIFLDRHRAQSLWFWVKREGSKTSPREHLYVQGQPGDLFLSKLSAMVFDISELDETGRVPVVEVAGRLKAALDVEQVTKNSTRNSPNNTWLSWNSSAASTRNGIAAGMPPYSSTGSCLSTSFSARALSTTAASTISRQS